MHFPNNREPEAGLAEIGWTEIVFPLSQVFIINSQGYDVLIAPLKLFAYVWPILDIKSEDKVHKSYQLLDDHEALV